MRGKQKTFFCQFLFFGGALIVDSLEVVGWYRQSHIGSDQTASFFSRDFTRSNNDTLWHVVSTGSFYILFS